MRRVMVMVVGVMVVALVGSMTLASPSRREARNPWGLPVAASESQAASTNGDGDGDQRLVLISRNATETFIDNPPEGDSVGDESVITSPLYRRGERVGRLDVHLLFTEVTQRRFAFEAHFTATLPKGQIAATGVAVLTAANERGFDAAITGGTRRYDAVGGDVRVQFITQDAVRFTYDIEHLG
jgi:hypothetical protein